MRAFYWLIAWTTGNTFLSISVTFWDAQDRSNKCNSCAKGFSIDDIQTCKYNFYIRLAIANLVSQSQPELHSLAHMDAHYHEWMKLMHWKSSMSPQITLIGLLEMLKRNYFLNIAYTLHLITFHYLTWPLLFLHWRPWMTGEGFRGWAHSPKILTIQ